MKRILSFLLLAVSTPCLVFATATKLHHDSIKPENMLHNDPLKNNPDQDASQAENVKSSLEIKKTQLSSVKKQIAKPSTIKTDSALQADKLHRYFMANYYQASNKIEKSHTWYNRLTFDGMPPYAYPGYIRFLHTLGQHNHIYTLIPKVDSILPNDPDIQLIFAQVLEQAGKEQESHDRVIKLSHNFPLNEEICYAAAQIFIKRQEPAKAIAAIDALINTAPRKQNTFIFHYSKAVAQLSMDSKQQALVSVKKSLELQPRFDRGWLLYSLIEEQLGNTKEALRGYAAYLNLAGKKLLIELHVQHLKDSKQGSHDTSLKNEQQSILDMVTHKHACNQKSPCLKEILTRFARLESKADF